MNVRLESQSYGKSKVRFTKVIRHGNLHHLVECSVFVQLDGDFESTYLTGDNSQVIPTDTVKNTVYAIARRHEWIDIETYGRQLTQHFLDSFHQVKMATARMEQVCWQRASIDGKPHGHAFVRGPSEVAKCLVKQTRESCFVESGFSGLQVLKTTESGFVGYVVDQYTTLQPTEDRIFATTVDSSWRWISTPSQCDAVREQVRNVILKSFAGEYSPSVQFTMYRIGQRILEEISAMKDISLAMPNQHRLLVDMSKMGMDNPNAIFCPTDEPYGDISATIGRVEPE